MWTIAVNLAYPLAHLGAVTRARAVLAEAQGVAPDEIEISWELPDQGD